MRTNGLRTLLTLCILVSACGDDDDKKSDDAGSARDGSVADASAEGGAGDGGMDARVGEGGTGEGGTGEGGTPGTGSDAGSPFVINDAGQIMCGSGVCACSDGVDGDSDGLVDMADPECVSAWDNDEASFATGIPGDNRDDCQDCFFDGNSGSGDDGCRTPTSCVLTGTNDRMGSCGGTCEQT